jgi:glycosyltransferase involved in cell wall biosynthesis
LRPAQSFVSIKFVSSHKKTLTVSIVIPVYNEERYLQKCLKAIDRQTVLADEVIVVNNNSTDKSEAIAKQFPFVKLVQESKQGIANARDRGYEVASGDILARIDADVEIFEDWVEQVILEFQDSEIVAVTGNAITYVPPFTKKHSAMFWSKIYFLMANSVFRIRVLWGANMAIRRDTWQLIKNEVCTDDKIVHEDQDISVLLAGRGLKIKYDPKLIIKTEGETYFYWPKFKEYVQRSFRTLAYHRRKKTLKNPRAIRLSPWFSVGGIMLGLLPSIFFISGSYIYYLVTKSSHKSEASTTSL